MPRLTPVRAALAAAFVAGVVYLGALGNQWALDDHALIERNPAVHSLAGAVGAAFSPYWPSEEHAAGGLYRPLVILTYAVDWAISGGAPWWFHLGNILLHGAATALVVAVALAWLSPVAACAAGLVFAVHPVHVEAVANVVGRAELLAAVGLLGAVLAARRYRSTEHAGRRRVWFVLVLAATAMALLSKEHAVMAMVLLAVDHMLDGGAARRRDGEWVYAARRPAVPPSRRPIGAPLYLAITSLTVAWLFLWRAITGGVLESGAAMGLANLSLGERLATAIPVQLEVVRLLVWPAELAADYSPQTIPVRSQWRVVATLALATSVALLWLAVALRRAAPAVSFGILAAAATYLPTANLLFASGVFLAERNLYLAVLAPSLAVGWGVARAAEQGKGRVAGALLAAILVLGGAGTAARVPFWRDSRTVVIEGALQQPENYRTRAALARALELSGDTARAVAEYAASGEIFEGYAAGPAVAAHLALRSGRPILARDLVARAHARNPDDTAIIAVLVDVLLALGRADSALTVTRGLLDRSRTSVNALQIHLGALAVTGAPPWQRLLAGARLDWRRGLIVSSAARLDSAVARIPGIPGLGAADCWELRSSIELLRTLLQDRATVAEERHARECL